MCYIAFLGCGNGPKRRFLRYIICNHALTSEVMWQIGRCESVDATLLFLVIYAFALARE